MSGDIQFPCQSVLMIKGESFPCQTEEYVIGAGHEGWAHSNRASLAIWGEPENRRLTEKMRKDIIFSAPVELEVTVGDPAQKLVDFLRWAWQENRIGIPLSTTMNGLANEYISLKEQGKQ